MNLAIQAEAASAATAATAPFCVNQCRKKAGPRFTRDPAQTAKHSAKTPWASLMLATHDRFLPVGADPGKISPGITAAATHVRPLCPGHELELVLIDEVVHPGIQRVVNISTA